MSRLPVYLIATEGASSVIHGLPSLYPRLSRYSLLYPLSLGYPRPSTKKGPKLPAWPTTAPRYWEPASYTEGVFLASVHRVLQEIWYQTCLSLPSKLQSVLPGDVVSLQVFGTVIVVLNSVKATKDLLERRGEIYSDRPVIPFHKMCVFKLGVPVS